MVQSKKQVLTAWDIAWPLLISSMLSALLFLNRAIGVHSTRYWFLLWNLFLAWLPLTFAWLLARWLKTKNWSAWQGIVYSALWLGFLPNSFYLVTDFIHLRSTGEVSLLYDAVLFMSFAWNGLLLGFASVLLIHYQLIKKFGQRVAAQLLTIVFLLCSFAIYLGRYLGWNTWDVLLNPAGILFDLSERLVTPRSFPNTFTTTTMFFALLTVTYYATYRFVVALRGKKL